MKIEEMIDCPHTVRCLNKADIETMEQLIQYSRDDLLQIRGIGQVIADSVSHVIAAYVKSGESKTGKK